MRLFAFYNFVQPLAITFKSIKDKYSFNGRLKAELFRRAYGIDLEPMRQLSVNSLCEHKFTYLLTYLLNLVTVHRCLRNQAPTYLIDYCVPVPDVAGHRHLRSASRHQLTVPRVRCSTFGCRSFASAGPTVWNSLPNSLCNPAVGPDQFRRTLKTHLFACC